MDLTKFQLKTLLLSQSYEKRELTLSSGKKSDFYFDGKQTTLHPAGIVLVGLSIWNLLRDTGKRIQAVGGPTLGADPMVSAVATVAALKGEPMPAFIVRKEPKKHGTQNWIEGEKNIPTFAQVALLEDVVTTGKSLLKAAEKVEQAGYFVNAVVTLVDREEGAREAIEARGYSFYSLFTKTDLLS